MSGVHLRFRFTFRMTGATLRPMKHRLLLLTVSLVVAIVGVGVGLVVLVWVLRRVLDANSKVVDELAGVLKRVTTPEPIIDYDVDGVRHVAYPGDLLRHEGDVEGWTTQVDDKGYGHMVRAPEAAVRAAAAEVQAIANQLSEPATYLDHTDEFVPEETDALFGPLPTIPAQNFIKDFAEGIAWPGE